MIRAAIPAFRTLAATALAVLAFSRMLRGAELQKETLEQWNQYVSTIDVRTRTRLDGSRPFLWVDESPSRRRNVRHGDVVVVPLVAKGMQSVTGGLIHHWIGAIFVPNSDIKSLFRVLADYERYTEIYTPDVAESRVLGCSEGNLDFSMIWKRRVLFVNAAIEGQYRSSRFTIDPHRGFTIADTVEVREIENYGNPSQRILPPDTGSGFIWRLHSIARYEQRDGGVYLELEAIALSRTIPASLRWLVTPVVNHLSATSLTTMLRQTAAAVTSAPGRSDPSRSCRNEPISTSRRRLGVRYAGVNAVYECERHVPALTLAGRKVKFAVPNPVIRYRIRSA